MVPCELAKGINGVYVFLGSSEGATKDVSIDIAEEGKFFINTCSFRITIDGDTDCEQPSMTINGVAEYKTTIARKATLGILASDLIKQ